MWVQTYSAQSKGLVTDKEIQNTPYFSIRIKTLTALVDSDINNGHSESSL